MQNTCIIILLRNDNIALNECMMCPLIAVFTLFYFSCSVPALPVKNLTGSGPVHPALAGQTCCSAWKSKLKEKRFFSYLSWNAFINSSFPIFYMSVCCAYPPGMTGILMCAAGLPVCLTRAPKPILHPPPINKSDMKPVPGINGMRRKTKKKHLRRGEMKETLEMLPVFFS